MLETTLEMIGEKYPDYIEYPKVMLHAFEFHRLEHTKGKHPGTPEIMTPIRPSKLPGHLDDVSVDGQYCECYARAWWDIIGLPLEMMNHDPGDDLFEKRL